MARPGTMRARSGQKKKSASKGKSKRKPGRPPKLKSQEADDDGKPRRRPGRPRKATVIIESDDEDEEMQIDDELEESDEYTAKFPIVLTTYDMIIRDRTHLAHYNWGYIVVDEGHRLKNLNCKLMTEIKKYSSAGRMILTGTPLHVCVRIFIRCSWPNALHRIISPSYGRCSISFFLISSVISTPSKTGS